MEQDLRRTLDLVTALLVEREESLSALKVAWLLWEWYGLDVSPADIEAEWNRQYRAYVSRKEADR